MFWKYNAPSAEIEALLQKEDVSLRELMSEDELLQECKIPNKKVIDFLTKPDVIEELVLMIVSNPSDSVDLGVRFKNANLAAEILTCDALIDKLVASSNLLQHLYKFFHNEKPLNPILASFVSKVFATPVQRKCEQNWYSYQFNCFQVLEFIKSKDDFVDIMINHVGTSAVMDFMSQLISGVEEDEREIKNGIHKWLDESYLVEKLVEKLSPESDSEEHASIDSILCEIAYTRRTQNFPIDDNINLPNQSLVTTLESEKVLNKLLDILLKENWSASSVSHVINIIITLFSAQKSVQNLDQISSTISSTLNIDWISLNRRENISVLKTVLQRLPELQLMLLRPNRPETIPTAFGCPMERLGSTRLHVVTFVCALICSSFEKLHQEIAELNFIEILLDMFYKFPLNNFLHTQVTQAIFMILWDLPTKYVENPPVNNVDDCQLTSFMEANVMETQQAPLQVATLQEMCKNVRKQVVHEHDLMVKRCARHPLLHQLFTKCQIVQKLLADLSKSEVKEEPKKKHNTKGYLGHLRLIANTIQGCRKSGVNGDFINRYIQDLPDDVHTDWEYFTLITLTELNIKNQIIPIKITSKSGFDSDSDDDFYICAQPSTMIIINQDFKSSEMETNALHDEGAFRNFENKPEGESLDFGNQEENWNDMATFEKMCSEKIPDSNEFENMWKFQEKEIKFPDNVPKNNEVDEVADDSSSDEDGEHFTSLKNWDDTSHDDEDKQLSNLKSSPDTIDADDDDWSEVFDKRNETAVAANNNSDFNPWHSATAQDTSDNSWANFEQQRSTAQKDSFFFSLAKASNESTNQDGENVPPAVFEVDFHTAFSAEKSPFYDGESEPAKETHPTCDSSKLLNDECMQNSQESSNDTSNI